MTRCCLSILFITALWYASTGQDLIVNVAGRSSIPLDGKWHYIVDPYENGYYDYRREPFDQRDDPGAGAYFTDSKPRSPRDRVEYDFDLSPTLQVPGDWNTQDDKLFWYEGTIWYKRDFNYRKQEGKRVFLYFGAANYQAEVYVNGKKAGMHTGGFTPFHFDITGLLRENGENFVVVKVDNTRHPEAVPTVSTDWWNYGGLTRSVRLVEVPQAFIRSYKVQLRKGSRNEIEGFVQLDGAAGPQQVRLQITEAGIDRSFHTDASGRASFRFPAEKLALWEPANPKLYEVQLSSGNDALTDRMGFRTIEVQGTDILLNGKKLFLRGICLHEENPMTGRRAYGEADARMLFEWVRELNANFVRLAHYPHNENMPRLADELGILLWEEIPVYWTIQWQNPATLANAQQQLTELISRDRNRASVIIWSMANETPVSDARNTFLKALVDTARTLDDTRLISAAMERHERDGKQVVDDPFGRYTDLISFNQYYGWYGGDPANFPNLQWEVAYDKPVIVSEFGAGAQYGFHADSLTVWSEEHQAYLYRKTLEGITNIPHLSGFTPWILADFRSPRRPLPNVQDMWNRKGLVSEGGHKKMAFEVLRAYYESIK